MAAPSGRTGRVFLADLSDGDRVEGTFLVNQKQTALTRAGKPYLIVKVQDRTGELAARVWEDAEEMARRFELGDIVFVQGAVESYNGKLQLRLDSLRRVPSQEVDPSDFLPTTRYNIEEMWNRLLAIVKDLKDPHVKGLLLDVLTEKSFSELFRKAPAAKGIHHPWIGGLLEHVLSLAHLAKRVCPHYPHVDENQVVFGCIMHDMGKVWELSYDRAFGYTDEGKLVGHLVMGVIKVSEAIAKRKDFPPELALRLKHILVAHHGTYEFGSPKLPQTLEAELVHRLDDLDSKINAITEQIRRPSAGEPEWTEYNGSMGRSFFRGEGEPPTWPEKLVELPKEQGAKAAPAAGETGSRAEGAPALDLFQRAGRK